MKKLFCLLFVVAVCTLALPITFAQTTAVSDQKFDELIKEVRQLRLEVQRLSTSAQRMQLLLERARSQQEQVVRLTQQVSNVRDELSGVRARLTNLKDALAEAEKGKEAGMISPREINALNAEQRELNQREQRLSARELQLASEWELERSTLNELKTRLDKLENEIAMPTSEPTKKRD
ncbi:MAG TPA: hypothetical protein VFZ34_01700 [Blastocatellia bacterium]|nr:hypothetical protein [Blastocatellia bacterium]